MDYPFISIIAHAIAYIKLAVSFSKSVPNCNCVTSAEMT